MNIRGVASRHVFAFLTWSAGVVPASAAEPADLLKRLEALEQRVQELEGRNKELETRNQTLERAATPPADDSRPPISEQESSRANSARDNGGARGNVTFDVTGSVAAEFMQFNERAGGYNYGSGTDLRRARLGVAGEAFGEWRWAISADIARGNVTAAYVAYVGVPGLAVSAGLQRVPFGLESNSSDNNNTFLDRSLGLSAMGGVAAERRIGTHVVYGRRPFTFAVSLSGENDRAVRTDAAPFESVGLNARGTWTAIAGANPHRVLQVGASGLWRSGLKSDFGSNGVPHAIIVSQTIDRVDGGDFADTGLITDVHHVHYFGAEIAGAYRTVWAQAEYGELTANRYAPLDSRSFKAGYVSAGWFLTGEGKPYRNGTLGRIRPLHDASLKSGGIGGAWEIAVRYDWFDFSRTPVIERIGNDGYALTAGVNWYLNPNLKMQINWARFDGGHTPLDPVGDDTKADMYGARLQIDW